MTPLAALLRAKTRIARHALAGLRRESKLKIGFVTLTAGLLWLGLFVFARVGFRLFEIFGAEVFGTPRLSELVMARLLSSFTLALFVLLIFSNLMVVYATLYRGREVELLLASPISTTTLFLGRFAEALVFSSWASAFLGAPALLAYGLETGAAPVFYLALAGFYLPFVVIPAALGALAVILLVRLLAGHRRRLWLALAVVAALVLVGVFRARFAVPDFATDAGVETVIANLGAARSPLMPSTWVARGVLAAAAGEYATAATDLLRLAASALGLLAVATLAARRWFFAGFSALRDGDGGRAPRSRRGGLFRPADRLLRVLPEPLRALTAKDLRLFWRDPAQWTQFVLFFGLMALYVANLGGARALAAEETWRGWITLLNGGAAMLILASLTTRFIFPLISLEGRRLWILGLAPVTMRQIVWQKFALSVVTTSVFTVGVAVISAVRLELDGTAFALSVAAVAAATFALSGLAVGLGSLYPNFQEDNPSRIVSGLGGTLNFLLSLLYVVLISAGQAVVLLWSKLDAALGSATYPWAVAAVFLWIVALSALTGLMPLFLGLRNLERVEI